MTTKQHLSQIASRIEHALTVAGEVDLLRLYRKAAYLLPGTGIVDSIELFNEAIARTLEGTRTWPTNVPFEAYMWMAVKSIADAERKHSWRAHEVLANDIGGADDGVHFDAVNGYGDDALAVDQVLIDQRAWQKMALDLEKIEEFFKDDPAVTLVIMALEDGIPPRDLALDYDMSNTQYESAKKKLRRGVDRLFPGRRKNDQPTNK